MFNRGSPGVVKYIVGAGVGAGGCGSAPFAIHRRRRNRRGGVCAFVFPNDIFRTYVEYF